jgi:hypothetical protein
VRKRALLSVLRNARLLRAVTMTLGMLLAVSASAQEPASDEPAPQAPHVVVLSMGGDAPEAIAREAREAVAAGLAQDGMRVLSEGDVALRMPPSRLRDCSDIACAHALGLELGVATVAAVTVWMTGEAASAVTVSLIVSETRAHTASEDVRTNLAAASSAAVRGAQQARSRALLVEGSVDPERAVREAEERAVIPPPEAQERPIEQYVLPTIMGALGLVFVGTSVYALMDEQCSLRGASGVCLRGDRPNIGLGAILAVVGGLAVAGAIVWLVLGGQPQAGGAVDVVVGPDGGGLSWRGSF